MSADDALNSDKDKPAGNGEAMPPSTADVSKLHEGADHAAMLALQTPEPAHMGRKLAFLIVGVLALAAIIIAVLNAGEIGAFAAQMANANPQWLLLAVASQCAAFFCTALAWRMVLVRMREPISLITLYPLSIAKLFADQALPSGGLSGAAFLLHALKKRGVSWDHAFSAFVFGAATFIAAFIVAALASFIAIAGADDAPRIVTAAARTFYVLLLLALLIGAGYGIFRWTRVTNMLMRHRATATIMTLSEAAFRRIGLQKALFARIAGVQMAQRLFDALTLWLAFMAIGAPVPFAACFIGVSIASVTATVAPTPMGIGAFEGGLIAALAVFGVPVEAALTGTLLYRGLSLWLPLLPGFFVIQREFLHTQKSAPKPAASGAP